MSSSSTPSIEIPLQRNRADLFPEQFYAPLIGIVLEITELVAKPNLSVGDRGWLDAYGTSMYDWHREVPFERMGVPIENVVVLELDDEGSLIRTPYRQWIRELSIIVRCGRCNEQILPETRNLDCPAR